MVMLYQPAPMVTRVQPRPARLAGRLAVGAVLMGVAAGSAFAFDSLRSTIVQAKLAHAVDSAALAGGRVLFDEQRDAHMRRFFEAAFPTGYLGARPGPLSISADPPNGMLTVSARATIRSLFQRIFDRGEIIVQADSIVRRQGRGADLVLARRAEP